MSSGNGRDWGKFRQWSWDVSTNTVGGLLSLAVVALAGLVVSFVHPVRSWLLGFVYLYGWSLIILVLGGVFCGYLIARLSLKRRKEALPLFASAAVPHGLVSFQPDELETRIIDVLRYADGRWVAVGQLIEFLEVSSRQELILAVRHLVIEGWIEGHEDNALRNESSQSFRLGAAGVAFAKANGFETQTEFERKQKDHKA